MARTLALAVAAALWTTFAAWSAAAQEYLIQVGDRLDISVLEDPSLNRVVLVRPDGRISLPLAGTLIAEGRTPEQVQAAIRGALAGDFIQPPTVTVALSALGQPQAEQEDGVVATIYIIGSVGGPGRYDVVLPLDILQALSIAGGPGVFAASDKIQIRRTSESGAQTVMLFDYDQIEDGAAPANLIPLMDGDVIVVPERGLFD